jgi:hypothetical protein
MPAEDPSRGGLMHSGVAFERTLGRRDSRSEVVPSKQWQAFIEFCRELGHGEIQVLKIQDGIPVLAEKVIEKVKFGP